MAQEIFLNNQFIYWVDKFIKELNNYKNISNKILAEKSEELYKILKNLIHKKSIYGGKFNVFVFFIQLTDAFLKKLLFSSMERKLILFVVHLYHN